MGFGMPKKYSVPPPPNRKDIENLILDSFVNCPFCGFSNMRFEWGQLVPRKMICLRCGATWEPLLNYDGSWSLVAARLITSDSENKGTKLLNKFYPKSFWEELCRQGVKRVENVKKLQREVSDTATKVVIIREVVKVRCPYCGALYDEVKDKCPYCGGKR